MFQTNDATKRLPHTYLDLEAEGARLVQIAHKMKEMAFAESEAFWDDQRFIGLQREAKAAMQNLLSLTGCF